MILGIDPGYRNLGLAYLTKSKSVLCTKRVDLGRCFTLQDIVHRFRSYLNTNNIFTLNGQQVERVVIENQCIGPQTVSNNVAVMTSLIYASPVPVTLIRPNARFCEKSAKTKPKDRAMDIASRYTEKPISHHEADAICLALSYIERNVSTG